MYLLDKNFHPSVETKPDPRSIEGLIAWLETMPAGGAYDYASTDSCLFCRYGESLGLGTGRKAYFGYLSLFGITRSEWFARGGEDAEPYHIIGVRSPETFGAALDRARAYQAKVRT